MSWAARRTTTLPEDMAYCLLGIFDINIPMLYGEGTKAFWRLQEEIIRKTNDLSIFSWEPQGSVPHQGVLSQTPREFSALHAISRLSISTRAPEFTMANKGIRITTPLREVSRNKTESRASWARDIVMPLDISYQNNRLLLFLTKFGPGHCARNGTVFLLSEKDVMVLKSDIVETIYLSAYSSPQLSKAISLSRRNAVHIRSKSIKIGSISPRSHWDPQHHLFFFDPEKTVILTRITFQRTLLAPL